MKISRMNLRMGETIPKGWGISYYSGIDENIVILPIPINWVVGISRKFWIAMKRGPDPSGFEKAIWNAEHKGFVKAHLGIIRELETSKILWDRVFAEVLKEKDVEKQLQLLSKRNIT